MTGLILEALAVQRFLEAKGWDFFFIGGIALQVWGQPRLTFDIDLTLFTDLKDDITYIRPFLERYTGRLPDTESFALKSRVVLLETDSGVGIDIGLGGIADLSEANTRASYEYFTTDIKLRICSAEDLIILKTIAARSRDWPDIETVLIKQSKLDWHYIEKSINDLRDVADKITESLEKLRILRSQYYQK